MAVRRCFVWIIQLLSLTRACFLMWTWVIQALIIIFLSWDILVHTKIGVHISNTMMRTPNALLGISNVWVRKCSFSIGLEWMKVHPMCFAMLSMHSTKMHAYYKVHVEWSIGGLKRKFASWQSDWMLRNQSKHTSLGLVSFWQTFFIEERWTYLKRLLKIKWMTQKHMGWGGGRLLTCSYM